MRMIMTVTVKVRMAACLAQFAQRAYGDPSSESDESDARRGIDEVAESRREGDSREPNDDADHQRGHDVAEAGHERGARGFAPCPSALASDQRDRHPVIGNDRMQDADGSDGANQQKLWGVTHRTLTQRYLAISLNSSRESRFRRFGAATTSSMQLSMWSWM